MQTERVGISQYRARDARVNDVKRVTASVNTLVLGSLAVSTLVTVLLFLYFMRTINNGIKLLVENTDRFKQGKALQPPSEEEDELAGVDAAFHAMVNEIREAQSTKQTIVSMISHDLRSPLTAVSGYFDNLNLGVLGDVPPEAIAVAENCRRDIDQLIRLITNLLDLDKIEAGMLALQPTILHVRQVLEKAIREVTSLTPESTLTINGDTAAEIYADHDRIVQALSNLLLGAVKVSPVGSSVDTNAIQRNGNVEIRVTSAQATTSGDLLSTQFDRYQKREHGLSLELPISKEIVRLHGGTIGAASDLRGCTLWVCLPARSPQPARQPDVRL